MGSDSVKTRQKGLAKSLLDHHKTEERVTVPTTVWSSAPNSLRFEV